MAFALQEKADDEAAEFAAAAGMPLPPGAAMASVPVPRPPPPVDEEPLILERPLKEPAPVAPTVGPTKRQRQLSAAAAFAEGQRVGREEAERRRLEQEFSGVGRSVHRSVFGGVEGVSDA